MKNVTIEAVHQLLGTITNDAVICCEAYLACRGDLGAVRDLLNPDVNTAAQKLGKLSALLRSLGLCTYSKAVLKAWNEACTELIRALLADYPEIESLNHSMSAQAGLYNLLVDLENWCGTKEEYIQNVAAKVKALKKSYRENSDGFNHLLVKKRETLAAAAQQKNVRTRTADPDVAKRRRDNEAVLREICRRYTNACEKGHSRSFSSIAQEMRQADSTYSARMRGKKVETWANQASAYNKKLGRAADEFAASTTEKTTEKKSLCVGNHVGNPVGNRKGDLPAQILELIKGDASLSASKMAGIIGVTTRTVERVLSNLRENGPVRRVGGTRGHWVVV